MVQIYKITYATWLHEKYILYSYIYRLLYILFTNILSV